MKKTPFLKALKYLDRKIALILAIAGALAFSQIPHFFDFYSGTLYAKVNESYSVLNGYYSIVKDPEVLKQVRTSLDGRPDLFEAKYSLSDAYTGHQVPNDYFTELQGFLAYCSSSDTDIVLKRVGEVAEGTLMRYTQLAKTYNEWEMTNTLSRPWVFLRSYDTITAKESLKHVPIGFSISLESSSYMLAGFLLTWSLYVVLLNTLVAFFRFFLPSPKEAMA
jgi:hypothetical protein